MRKKGASSVLRVLAAMSVLCGCSAAPNPGARTRSAHGRSTFSKSERGTAKARLSEVQTGRARVTYTHDERGRETRQSVLQGVGGAYSFESRYGYSADPSASGPGNVLVERTVPGGDTVRYAYDAAAQRKSVHYGDRVILAAETRDGAGRVVERNLGDGSTTRIRYYADTKQPSSIVATKDGTTVLSIEYEYDARGKGNPTRITDSATGPTEYRYDASNQLIAATSLNRAHSYEYDAIGNLVSIDGAEMTYDGSQPHAPTEFRGSAFGYDASGNRVADVRTGAHARTQELKWTDDNRVASVARDGAVVLEKSYIGERLLFKIERGEGGAENVTEYLPNLRVENGQLREQFDGLAERLPNGEYRFFHVDHLGSLRAVTTGEGTVVAQYAYEPFGEATALVGSIDPTRGYNGKETDSSDYANFGARDYDSFSAHWLSPDSENQDGLNRYAYVRNNPIRYSDPTGNASEACGSWCQFNRGRADAQWDTAGLMQPNWRAYYGQRSTANSWETGTSAWKWGYTMHQTAGVVAEVGWALLGAAASSASPRPTARPASSSSTPLPAVGSSGVPQGASNGGATALPGMRGLRDIARSTEQRTGNLTAPNCSRAALENAISSLRAGYTDVMIVNFWNGDKSAGHAVVQVNGQYLSQGKVYADEASLLRSIGFVGRNRQSWTMEEYAVGLASPAGTELVTGGHRQFPDRAPSIQSRWQMLFE